MKRWWLPVAAALAVLVIRHAWSSQFNHDEIEHLHAAWLVGQGRVPFSDFLEQHHPTLWYLLAPATRVFHTVHALIFAARLADLGLLAALLATVARMVRRGYPSLDRRLPILLLASSFMMVRNSMEVRPDPLMNTFIFLGLHAWIGFVQEGRFRRALAAGLFLGAAIAVLQKALVVLALVGAATLLLLILRRGTKRLRLFLGGALMLLCAVIPVAALFGFIAERGYFRDFWFWNYQFNRFFYLQAHLTRHFSVFVTIGISVAENPVLWIAGAVGMALCAREQWRQRRALTSDGEARLALLVIALGYLPFLVINRFPLEQYFIVLLPLLAVFSCEVFLRVTSPWLPRAVVFMSVICAVISLAYPASGPQREVTDYVLAQTTPAQTVFIPPAYNPVFRKHAGYFWYNGALIGDAYDVYCQTHVDCSGRERQLDLSLWKSHPPEFVYVEYPEYAPYRWSDRESAYRLTDIPLLWRVTNRNRAE